MHEPEALVVAERPLEVVHQRPLEVAANVDAGVDGASDRSQVLVEIVDPARVGASAVDDRIVVGAAVLGDVDRRQVRVVVAKSHEEVGEPVRRDRPAHVGVDLGLVGFGDTGDGRVRQHSIGHLAVVEAAHDDVEVVVDADPVERLADRVGVARLDGVGQRPVRLEEVGRVLAAQRGVEPPAVVDRVDETHLCRVGGLSRVADDVRRVDHDAELQVVTFGPHGLQRKAVGEQFVMCNGDRGVRVDQPRSVDARGVTEVGVAPGFVERRPHGRPGRRALGP